MTLDLNSKIAGQTAGMAFHDIDRQRLRILRCTAHAMAGSPGGLRFKAGTRPWLEGIASASPRDATAGALIPAPGLSSPSPACP